MLPTQLRRAHHDQTNFGGSPAPCRRSSLSQLTFLERQLELEALGSERPAEPFRFWEALPRRHLGDEDDISQACRIKRLRLGRLTRGLCFFELGA